MAALLKWGPWVALIILVGSAGAYVQGLRSDLAETRAELRTTGLYADALEAELDTTRLIAGQHRRRALQVEIERDSLAQALDERPVVEIPVVVQLPPQVDTIQAEMTDSTAYSKLDDESFVAEVTIQLTPPFLAEWKVEVKPVRALVGVRCGPVSQSTGVRPVRVTVETELWDVEIGEAQADPEVCNPEEPDPGGGNFWKGVGVGALAIISLGLIS